MSRTIINLGSPCQGCRVTTTRGRFCSSSCEEAYGEQPYTAVQAHAGQEDGQTLDEEINRHTFPTPVPAIFQTIIILETPDGQVYATVAAHAKDREPPENATCTVTDEAEVARLAAEVAAAKRAERPRPTGTQMLSRSRAQASTTAGG